MTVQTQQVLEKAIHLPPVERAELVEQILSSFNCQSRDEIDELWAREAEDRIDAYDQDKIKAIHIHLVPFDESENDIQLKTIIPSRKATKKYLKGKHDET